MPFLTGSQCDALVLLDLKVRIRHSRTDESNEERHNIWIGVPDPKKRLAT